jgi:hypothetical protein
MISRKRCCVARSDVDLTLFPSSSDRAGILDPFQGREAVHRGNACVDFGSLAVGTREAMGHRTAVSTNLGTVGSGSDWSVDLQLIESAFSQAMSMLCSMD